MIAACGKQPGAGEIIIRGERRELVPVVVHGIDMGFVGALEVALQLQIVRRIRKDKIDRSGLQLRHLGDAIAEDDASAGLGVLSN
jgi:hypothetical protein